MFLADEGLIPSIIARVGSKYLLDTLRSHHGEPRERFVPQGTRVKRASLLGLARRSTDTSNIPTYIATKVGRETIGSDARAP